MSHLLVAYLAPLILLAAAFATQRLKGKRPEGLAPIAEGATLAALAAVVLSVFAQALEGPGTSPLIGFAGAGFAAKLDSVSATLSVLVAFVGWIVIRYSNTYLDGEARQAEMTGWILGALAAVLLLVTSGNVVQLGIAWIATGICLRKLLLFYPDRIEAQRAARKMTFVVTFSDIALVAGLGVIALAAGTGNIGAILIMAQAGALPATTITAGALLLAIAALAKSAQFPLHGWLAEVMETPTPVSALLHAGIINAGGFLLIRFADVIIAAPWVMAFLAMVGGFTALFAGAVMLTQPSVKTALAWSTVAQMGFMILQCGLGLFALALLHIVAHSLYKAHAFLTSGTAVERIAADRRPGPVAVPDSWAVLRAFALAIGIYALLAYGFGYADRPVQAAVLGAILIFGVAYLIAQGLADAAPRSLTIRTTGIAAAASLAYFAFQAVAEWLTAGQLPPPPVPGTLEWVILAMSVAGFGAVAFAQAMLPAWRKHPKARLLRTHLANGFYVNALFDRATGGWSTRPQG